MINLLPADEIRQLKAARANTLLVRYLIIAAALIILLLGAVATTYQLLSIQKTAAETRIAENQQKTTNYSSVQQQADTVRTALGSAKTAMDSDVNYSKALLRIAAALPASTHINTLTLDAQSLTQPLTLEASVNSEEEAYALRTALQKSEYVVPESVSFGNLITPSGDNPNYTLEISVTFKKEITQ